MSSRVDKHLVIIIVLSYVVLYLNLRPSQLDKVTTFYKAFPLMPLDCFLHTPRTNRGVLLIIFNCFPQAQTLNPIKGFQTYEPLMTSKLTLTWQKLIIKRFLLLRTIDFTTRNPMTFANQCCTTIYIDRFDWLHNMSADCWHMAGGWISTKRFVRCSLVYVLL